MASGRSKKNRKKNKAAKSNAVQLTTVQSNPVRTELSPYNRDYVEMLPPTVMNMRSTLNMVAAKAGQKIGDKAKGQTMLQSVRQRFAAVSPGMVRAAKTLAYKFKPNRPQRSHRSLIAVVMALVVLGGLAFVGTKYSSHFKNAEIGSKLSAATKSALSWSEAQMDKLRSMGKDSEPLSTNKANMSPAKSNTVKNSKIQNTTKSASNSQAKAKMKAKSKAPNKKQPANKLAKNSKNSSNKNRR